MKSIDDALELRGRIFGAFELAELGASRGENVDRLLTFVVVGAGPTGVEMAGQIAELAHRTLKRDFRAINTTQARVVLVDAAGQVLPPFGAKLGAKTKAAAREARGRGACWAPWSPTSTSAASWCSTRTARTERIAAVTKIWAAGVQASSLTRDAVRADRRAARPRRTDRCQPRPHPARLSRGLRGRRHDRPRPPARGRAGRHPGRQVRREARSSAGSRASRRSSRSSTSTRARWPRSAASAPSR